MCSKMTWSISLICIIFVLLVTPTSGENNTCGALITYNQFSHLLESAPTCFQNGCGAGALTSMSSACNSNAPCYPIWKILSDEYQQDWCSNCTGDVACRIPGWPILNATKACDISPNTWIFGNGGCCIESGEPANLSSWIETLCNDAWENQFAFYAGMAPEDWDQWRLPWNWTVASDNNPQSTCTDKPRYLGLFAVENLVFLIFVAIYLEITLWMIRGKEQDNHFVLFILKLLAPIRWVKGGIVRLCSFVGPSSNIDSPDNGTSEVVAEILTAILFAGIQLGFNFATAYLIKYTPGYSHVPAPLLALLFCCRPRIGWLACMLSRTPNRWLKHHFHLSLNHSRAYPEGSFVEGKKAVSRVALSSAMSEVIMQLLGSYFLGITAHVGTIRGFYWHDHLSPYYSGLEARNMYGGAMFWLAAGFFVVLVWLFVVACHAAIMRFFTRIQNQLKNIREAAAAIPEKIQSIRKSRSTSKRSPKEPLIVAKSPWKDDSGIHSGEGLLMRGGAGTPGTYGSSELPSGYQNIRGGGSGSFKSQDGASSPSPYEALPIRPQDFQAAASSSSSRQGSRPITQRGGYRAIPVSPEIQIRPEDFPSTHGQVSARVRSSLATSVNTPGNPDFIQRANPSPYDFPDTGYHGVQGEDPSDGREVGEKSPPEPQEDNNLIDFPSTWEELQPYILGLGVFLGFLSYIAQWLFWAGFVYTAGDRFCPPSLTPIGTLWSLAAILGLGSSFSSHF